MTKKVTPGQKLTVDPKALRVRATAMRSMRGSNVAPNGQTYDMRFIASTERLASDGGVILLGAWKFDEYVKRPRFLANHDIYGYGDEALKNSAIGRTVCLQVEQGFSPSQVGPTGNALVVYVRFMPTRYAQEVLQLYEEGGLDDVSVRWDPVTTIIRAPYQQEVNQYGDGLQWICERADLMEVSAVLFGADPGAQAVRSKVEPILARAKAAGKSMHETARFIRKLDKAAKEPAVGTNRDRSAADAPGAAITKTDATGTMTEVDPVHSDADAPGAAIVVTDATGTTAEVNPVHADDGEDDGDDVCGACGMDCCDCTDPDCDGDCCDRCDDMRIADGGTPEGLDFDPTTGEGAHEPREGMDGQAENEEDVENRSRKGKRSVDLSALQTAMQLMEAGLDALHQVATALVAIAEQMDDAAVDINNLIAINDDLSDAAQDVSQAAGTDGTTSAKANGNKAPAAKGDEAPRSKVALAALKQLDETRQRIASIRAALKAAAAVKKAEQDVARTAPAESAKAKDDGAGKAAASEQPPNDEIVFDWDSIARDKGPAK